MSSEAQERIDHARRVVLDLLRNHFGIEEGDKGLRIAVVGSAFIEDNVTNDVDILVHHPALDPIQIGGFGWDYGGSATEGDGDDDNDLFGSWKRVVLGVTINLLVAKESYWQAWATAAEVCRFLHLAGVKLDKGARIGIHEIIMDDNDAETTLNLILGRPA